MAELLIYSASTSIVLTCYFVYLKYSQSETIPVNLDFLKTIINHSSIRNKERCVSLCTQQLLGDNHISALLRAFSDPSHQDFMACCVVIDYVSKQEVYTAILVKHKILKIASKLLENRALTRYVRGGNLDRVYCILFNLVFRLSSESDRLKLAIVRYGILTSLAKHLDNSDNDKNSDVKYWCLSLIHSLTLVDYLHVTLIEEGIVSVLCNQLSTCFGNVYMQKLLVHALVRLVSNMNEADSFECIRTLGDKGMVAVLLNGLKSEDLEHVTWNVFLLFEFLVRGIKKDAIASHPQIPSVSIRLLSTSEHVIQRITVRMLQSLIQHDQQFLDKIAKNPKLIDLVTNCIKSRDQETCLLSVALLNDIFQNNKENIVAFKGIHVILKYAVHVDDASALYIADIIGYFIASQVELLKYLLVPVILGFCRSKNPSVCFAGTCVALSSVQAGYANEFVDKGGIETLNLIITKSIKNPTLDNKCAITACKSLIVVSESSPEFAFQVMAFTLQNVMTRMLKMHSKNTLEILALLLSIDVFTVINGYQGFAEYFQDLIPDAERTLVGLVSGDASLRVQSLKCLTNLVRITMTQPRQLEISNDSECIQFVSVLVRYCNFNYFEMPFDIKSTSIIDKLFYSTIVEFHNSPRNKKEYGSLMVLDSGYVYNPSWKFLTFISKDTPINGKGVYSYEYMILSEGLMQVGFTVGLEFNSGAGLGCGDTTTSWSYDGKRQCKWHASSKDNIYGLQWKIGDIVTCILDLVNNQISFKLNGTSMGVAFTVDQRDSVWYPCVSLAEEQGGQIRCQGLMYPEGVDVYGKQTEALKIESYTRFKHTRRFLCSFGISDQGLGEFGVLLDGNRKVHLEISSEALHLVNEGSRLLIEDLIVPKVQGTLFYSINGSLIEFYSDSQLICVSSLSLYSIAMPVYSGFDWVRMELIVD